MEQESLNLGVENKGSVESEVLGGINNTKERLEILHRSLLV